MIKQTVNCELEMTRRKFSWLNLKQYIGICLDGLCKTVKISG